MIVGHPELNALISNGQNIRHVGHSVIEIKDKQLGLLVLPGLPSQYSYSDNKRKICKVSHAGFGRGHLATLPLRRGLPYPSENNGGGCIAARQRRTGNQGPAGRYVSEMDDE